MSKMPLPIEPNQITPEAKTSMKARVITAVVLIVLCVPCLFLGGWFYFALIFLITGCCAYEIIHTTRPTQRFRVLIYAISFVLMYSFVFWIFVKNNLQQLSTFELSDKVLTNGFYDIEISTILVLVTAAFFFIISFLDEKFTVSVVLYYFGMIVICGICIQSFLYLRYSPFKSFVNFGYSQSYTETTVFKYAQSAFLLLYVLIGVMFNDIGAYFVGLFFGKQKINPRISPKKTWEGAIGGIVISLAFSLTFALVLDAVGYPLLPVLDLNHWYWVVVISILMPLVGDLGDFVFSAIKRYYSIKDFSHILPGHGGVLDRLDSLLFSSAFVSTMLIFINNSWDFSK